MASKKMKYASMAGIGIMTMSLVACANPNEQYQTLGDSGLKSVEESKYKDQCKEPELQKDGSYKCEEAVTTTGGGGSNGTGTGETNHSTTFIPFWLFNGQRYDSHNAMVSSSDYKKNNLVSGTKYTSSKADGRKGSSSKSSSSSSKTSGFGGASRGSTGGS